MNRTRLNDLIRWRASLEAIARTGMSFTPNTYDHERFEEILNIALEMGNGEELFPNGETEIIDLDDANDLSITARYVTPKIGVAVAIGNDDGQLLLIKRAASGIWDVVGGHADVGYSASEIAIREAKEEVGIDIEVTGLIAVTDNLQSPNPTQSYNTFFAARALTSEIKLRPLETAEAGWFGRNDLPSPLMRNGENWLDIAFDAVEGKTFSPYFDAPREQMANR